MSTRLSLSPDQITVVFHAARPLRPEHVESYLQVVAEQLRASPMVGDGTVHRAVEVAQRAFFDPRLLDTATGRKRQAVS
jgi:hypothetical protein